MTKKIISIIISIAFIALCLTIDAFAFSDTVIAPGGTVNSYDDLVAALGGDEGITEIKTVDTGDVVALKLFSDIIFKAPVIIESGKYTIYGSGTVIKRDFTEGDLFVIKGKDTSLVVGNPSGEGEKDDTIFNGEGKNVNGSVFKVEEGAIMEIYYGTVFKNILSSKSGGVLNSDGNVNFTSIDIDNSKSVGMGGAIYSGKNSELFVGYGSVKNCSSDIGGAIATEGKSTLIGVEISSSISTKGGAIYNSGEMKYMSAVISNCSAMKGGGIYNEGNLEYIGGSISECKSENGMGGGIFNTSELNMSGGTLQGNSAKAGGGVYNKGKLTLSKQISITQSKADKFGGNIYNDKDAELNMSSGSFTLGDALYGAGVFNYGIYNLSGGGIYSNIGKIGQGVFNAGSLILSGKGYVDPKNDLFVLIDKNNSHVINILEDWSYENQIIKLSAGYADNNGEYKIDLKEGQKLIDNKSDADLSKRFGVFGDAKIIVTSDGTLKYTPSGVEKNAMMLIFVVLAFVITVTIMVVVITYIENLKKSKIKK